MSWPHCYRKALKLEGKEHLKLTCYTILLFCRRVLSAPFSLSGSGRHGDRVCTVEVCVLGHEHYRTICSVYKTKETGISPIKLLRVAIIMCSYRYVQLYICVYKIALFIKESLRGRG